MEEVKRISIRLLPFVFNKVYKNSLVIHVNVCEHAHRHIRNYKDMIIMKLTVQS